jgi:ribulose-phosphate 3-epimerase
VVDVHLMIERPERHVDDFARAGADGITVHVEATPHVHYALQAVREAGARAGAAICPATPTGALADLAADALDLVLCMSVNPGWGNQALIPHSYQKLDRLRAMLPDHVALEVDGGVHSETIARCVEAGANLLVAGSAVFGAPDPAAAFTELTRAAAG